MLFKKTAALEAHLKSLDILHDVHAVSVALETPLLSNLSVIENIALIQEVHQRVVREVAHSNALEKLRLLGLEKIAKSRIATCSQFERFCVSMIRASMMLDAKIYIILPLQQFHTNNSIEDTLQSVCDINIQEQVIILDLVSNIEEYKLKGATCHIIE